MPSSAPIIDVAGDGELSDSAISALAALLLDLAEQGEHEAEVHAIADALNEE